MKFIAFGLLLLGGIGFVAAQDSSGTPPPMPEGPLLNRAPDFSTWTVVSQNVDGARTAVETDSAATGSSDSKKPKIVREISVTKTGRVIHELIIDVRGKKFDIWHNNGLQMINTEEGGISIFPDFGGGDIYTPNYAVADFSGVDWVSAQTYIGIKKVMGRECIVFKGELNTLARDEAMEQQLAVDRAQSRAMAIAKYGGPGGEEGAPAPDKNRGKVPAIAYIDLETRLPVAVTYGKEIRVYKFGTPPTAMLTLPASLAAAQNQYVAQQKRLQSLPARP